MPRQVSPKIQDNHPILDDVLSTWQAYRKHAYRVYNFSRVLHDSAAAEQPFVP